MTLKQGLCPACGSTEVFRKPAGVKGHQHYGVCIQTGAMTYLLGALMGGVELDGYLCSDCGHTEIGVPAARLEQVRKAIGARGWKRVERK